MASFYMKNTQGDELANRVIDIERDVEAFKGLAYLSCKGLLNKGKRKNVYTEQYADADELRVWQGDEVTREATNVEFVFAFVGENRQSAYNAFYNYVKNGRIEYWDDVRKMKALLVFTDALEPSEDIYVGSTPYIKATFKFTNVWGECRPADSLTI